MYGSILEQKFWWVLCLLLSLNWALTPILHGQIQNFDIDQLISGNVPAYTVRPGHPRLFITPENKNLIIQRISQTGFGQQTFQKVINTADEGMSIDFTSIQDGQARSVYPQFLPYIEAYGIIHQLGVIPGFQYGYPYSEYGQKGVEALMSLASLDTASQGSRYERNTALAVGYDWLYDLLTPSQRQTVGTRMIQVTRVWPVNTNDESEEGLAYNCPRGMEVMNILAFYGDGIADAWAEENLNKMVTQTLWGPKGSLSRLQVLMGGGVTEEEMTYAGRYKRFIPAMEAWYTATGQDFYQAGSFWRGFPKWIIHNLLPFQDNLPYKKYMNKMQQVSAPIYIEKIYYAVILGAASAWLSRMGENVYADVAAWLARQSENNYYNSLFFFGVLIGDVLRTPLSPKEANLPTHLIISGPIARSYMLSHWDDYDATYAMHSVTEWTCLRSDPYTMNSIKIWKNGGTLLTHKPGYRHDYSDMTPDFRYNTIGLYLPGDTANQFGAGGHLPGCDLRWIDVTWFTDKGGLLRGAEVIPGKYGYSAGDATRYYDAITDGAVTSTDRQFIWFQSQTANGSDYFLLFDRLTTDGTTVQPHIIFNTVGEPMVSNNFDTPIDGASQVVGHWIVQNAPAVTITNTVSYADGRPPAHARMFFKVLMPQNLTIHRLGGTGLTSGTTYPQGRSFSDIDLTYAMDINDMVWENRPNTLDATGMDGDWGLLGGRWRFHVVNQNLKSKNLYLMAMEVTDAGQTQPSGDMILLQGQSLVGALFADAIGLFNPVYEPIINGGLTLPSGSGGNYRLLISDLHPSTPYQIVVGNNQFTETSTSAGVIYLENVQLNSNDIISISQSGSPPALIVTNTTLPNAKVGFAYRYALQAVNGIKPYTWSIISGSLPDSLILIDNIITGVPKTEGTYTFTIQVADAASPQNVATQQLSLKVIPDSITGEGLQPNRFWLEQNYPNPFNANTTIRFSLAEESHVQIKIYDQLGALVRMLVDEKKAKGVHPVLWDGKNDKGEAVASGIYYYKMFTDKNAHVSGRKMILLR